MTFRYRLYGLDIESDIDLAPLGQAESSSGDLVRIVRAPISPAAVDRREPLTFVDTGGALLFAWAMVGAFRIATDGMIIEVDPNPGVPDSLVALPLLGTVVAALLQQRGLTVFHASAVSVCGRAIVLLGHKGAGKSTTAAALVAAGHRLIADDVVAIDGAQFDQPRVLPAAAQVRLWDDSRAALSDEVIIDHGRLHDTIDKSLYSMSAAAAGPVPLARFYLLGRGVQPGVRSVPPADAVAILLNQSYMARFGRRGFGATMPTHFARLARLSGSGRARILAVPAGLHRLGEIAPLIETDLATP